MDFYDALICLLNNMDNGFKAVKDMLGKFRYRGFNLSNENYVVLL
jgi:hypothetical protein